MDAKITLSFNESVIERAKHFAAKNNISLSRLTEFLLTKVTSGNHASLENLPISEWVSMVAEGEIEYQTKTKKNKELRKEFYKAKR